MNPLPSISSTSPPLSDSLLPQQQQLSSRTRRSLAQAQKGSRAVHFGSSSKVRAGTARIAGNYRPSSSPKPQACQQRCCTLGVIGTTAPGLYGSRSLEATSVSSFRVVGAFCSGECSSSSGPAHGTRLCAVVL
jgi:hypothetical protein